QYTVKASVDGGWFFKITEPLGDGKYDYKVIEKTTDGKTNTFNGYFIIDTKAPTNLTVEVEDSALGNATIANRPDLTLKGKTEALALVTIAVGGITYQTKADTQGNWSYTFDKNAFIINQPYNYTVTASDAAGNKISVNGVFRVDTITVAANIDTNSNSGDKNDNITNVATPTINGETAAGAKVTLVIGGKNYTTTANSDGKWAITVDSLKDNTYNYIVT
ncbi:Ig-like domain-containing protein, partial [Escherichia coli]